MRECSAIDLFLKMEMLLGLILGILGLWVTGMWDRTGWMYWNEHGKKKKKKCRIFGAGLSSKTYEVDEKMIHSLQYHVETEASLYILLLKSIDLIHPSAFRTTNLLWLHVSSPINFCNTIALGAASRAWANC